MSKAANAHNGWLAFINMNIMKYNGYVAVTVVADASGSVPLMDLQHIALGLAGGLNKPQVALFPGKWATNGRAHTVWSFRVLPFRRVVEMVLLHHGHLRVVERKQRKAV